MGWVERSAGTVGVMECDVDCAGPSRHAVLPDADSCRVGEARAGGGARGEGAAGIAKEGLRVLGGPQSPQPAALPNAVLHTLRQLSV